MRPYDYARFIGLAVIWSVQFILLRMAVPAFGGPLVAENRALFAAAVVLPAALIAGHQVGLLRHWRDYVLIGFTNNVVPFMAYAYAAKALPAGYLAIMNGLVPLIAAWLASRRLGEALAGRTLIGLLLGLAGVALIVNLGPVELNAATALAAGAVIVGGIGWAVAGIQIRERGHLPALSMAAGSTAWSALMMSPAWIPPPPAEAWTPEATFALIAGGVLCSGVAYLAFFTLVRDIGASRTLSVGYLVPVLGVFWGWLLLGETVTAPVLAGVLLVLGAMALVLRR